MPNLVMRFDMRNRQPGVAKQALYEAAIEMAAWADSRGFQTIQFAEHHGVDDGYNPSPIVLAAAIAARTKTVRLRFGLIILPLHDPIRLAEDLAVLDIVSAGRVDVVFGGGYAPHEFAMFGVDSGKRGRLVEEGVAAVKRAWTGEAFEFRGRKVRVTPTPVQQPRPTIWLGGSGPVAARRAARIADYFYTGDGPLYDHYRNAAIALGYDPGPWRDIGTGFFVVSQDPDRDWARLQPFIAHEIDSYRAWVAQSGDQDNAFSFMDMGAVRDSGIYPILEPEAAAEYAQARGVDGDLTLHPLIGGLDPAVGWELLGAFERHMLPGLVDDPRRTLHKRPQVRAH
jgi:alkanesulfonate monooxygenase SsuD/methylene tetrahydromethanopterin reductase-like flavin-dependent oxidoreductase (luciferase family)